MNRIVLGVLGGIFSIGLVLGFVQIAQAQEESPSFGGGSVQAYGSAEPLAFGTIVQLVPDQSNQVTVATRQQLTNMFGVVVDRNQLPLTLTTEGGVENETFVAVSGTYNALVSTEAGPIQSGDYVTLSAINGIAMKAGTEEAAVFGRANGGFDGQGVTLGTMQIQDVNGAATQTVSIGSIPVTVDIRQNPNIISTEANLPDVLQRVGQQIAEKEVNPIRIYLSLAIAVISVIAAIVMLYAGIRNAVISIGRNPMSRRSIFRALLEVVLTALLILIIGVFAVYLLLRL